MGERMARDRREKRVFQVFRYDPTTGEEGHFDRFELTIDEEITTTVLDVLFRIQKEYDPTLTFRYACRVGMCGSCGMVINGQEALACQTVIADLKAGEITVRPLNHFPIVKDLLVDMEPFFEKYREALPFFEAALEVDEPSIIRPDSKERRDIGTSTECIACGLCVSSCTMAGNYDDYLGPGALNRAFTLLADSRDGLHRERLERVLQACYHCRTEFNCTEVCPKELSPTSAIKYIQRLATLQAFRREAPGKEEVAEPKAALPEMTEEVSRRQFLARVVFGMGAATAVALGGLLTAAAFAPSMRERQRKWVPVGRLEEFGQGRVKTINISYNVRDGFYEGQVRKPVMVSRMVNPNEIVAFNSRCTHLGCTVHWDEGKKLFLCACHGGTFYPDGRVKAGPPPRPLERYQTRLESGELLILEA